MQEVGLYYSSRSRDWYGREQPWRAQQAFIGAHRALVNAHIPFGVVLDENVTAEVLRAFPVVYLPGITILSERETDLLRAYVAAGGHLLVTGLTGLFGPLGEELPDSRLSELIGAQWVETLSGSDNHVRFTSDSPGAEPLCRDIPQDGSFLVYGPAVRYAPTTAADFGHLLRPHRTLRQRKGVEPEGLPMSPAAPVGPAILVNTFGAGTVITLACSPDAGFASEYRLPEQRLLIRNLLRALNPTPDIEVEAPLHVESVLTRDAPNRLLRVHLVGYLSPPACSGPGHSRPTVPSLMEEAPLYRAKVRLRLPFVRVSALNPTTAITELADGIEALINDVHETLIVQY